MFSSVCLVRNKMNDSIHDNLLKIRQSIKKVMVCKEETLDLLLTSLLAKGHVLIEDVPGIGKTTLAKTLANTMSLSFVRIQFTPDIMPSDVTGFSMMDFSSNQFIFHEGLVMSQIVLADEINRASPKTQSSLLEAMQENQVTVDGKSYELPKPFMVIATQNPVDFAGTYPLPEAQLDRFLMRINLGYPSISDEVEIINRSEKDFTSDSIEESASVEDVISLQESAFKVKSNHAIKEYIAMLCSNTRSNRDIQMGASPRAAIALNSASKAYALLNKRDYVIPDDVQYLLKPILSHRIVLKPEARLRDMTQELVLNNVLKAVQVPGVQ